MLDLAAYRDDINERSERKAMAARFEEPDRVPVCFGMGGSYYCWLQGVNIRDYYATPEMQPAVKLRGYEWEYETLKADSSVPQGLSYEAGPLGEAIVFDTPFERPDDTSPRMHTVLASPQDIDDLKLIDPAKNERLKEFSAAHARFVEAAQKVGTTLAIGEQPRIGIHPPLSAACALMDPTIVLEYMYTNPAALQTLLDKMYEAFITYADYFDDLYGTKRMGSVGLADDNISMISGEMFRRWEMPYYLKLKERYQATRFYLHTDGPNDQHFKILADEVGLTAMDIGGYSKLENAVRDMKGKVYIHGGLWCKDFYTPGPMTSATRRKVLEAIRLAAPGGGFELAIGGECYVGVSPEGIADCVRFVDECGRYPIDITDELVEEVCGPVPA